MDRALTATEKDLFRTRPHRVIWRVAVHRPASLFSAPILETPVQYPASRLSLDGDVSTGNHAWAKRDMTVMIGTIPGASDEGIFRLRQDMPNASTMQIAESGSGLNRLYAGKWVTVIEQFRPLARHPRYARGASQWRMDFNLTAGTKYADGNIGPVAIMGPPEVLILTKGNTASFIGASSYAVSNTVSTALWQFPDGSQDNDLGTEASPVTKNFSVTYPRGNYFSLKVTDSSGGSELSRRLIWIFDDETQLPLVEFGTIEGDLYDGGYTGSFTVKAANASHDYFPEGAEVAIFEEAWYGDTKTSIGSNYPGREHIVMRGWIVEDTVRINPFSGEVSFKLEGIQGVMRKATSYDVFHSYVDSITGASDYVEMEKMSLDRVAIAFIKDRSTIAGVADFHPASTTETMQTIINYQDLPEGNLWGQLHQNYVDKGTRGILAADAQGAIYAMVDANITGGSDNLPLQMVVRKGDRRDTLAWTSLNYDSNTRTQMYGVMVLPSGSEWRGENTSIIPVGGESPGNVHGYYGGKTEHARGLVVDTQDRIITWSGNWRAVLNSRYQSVNVPLSGYLKIDPIPQARIHMTLSAIDNDRGLSWANKEFFPIKISHNYEKQTVLTDIQVTEVVNGKGGSAITFPRVDEIVPPPIPSPPPQPVIPPPGSIITFTATGSVRMYDAINRLWYTRDTNLTGASKNDLNGITNINDSRAIKCGQGYILISEDIKWQ